MTPQSPLEVKEIKSFVKNVIKIFNMEDTGLLYSNC